MTPKERAENVLIDIRGGIVRWSSETLILVSAIAAAITKAVAEERERCAALFDNERAKRLTEIQERVDLAQDMARRFPGEPDLTDALAKDCANLLAALAESQARFKELEENPERGRFYYDD